MNWWNRGTPEFCLSVFLSFRHYVFLIFHSLSAFLSVLPSFCLSIFLSIYLSYRHSDCLSICPSAYLWKTLKYCSLLIPSFSLSVYPPICPSCLSVCFFCLSAYLWKTLLYCIPLIPSFGLSPTCLSIFLFFTYPSFCLSFCLSAYLWNTLKYWSSLSLSFCLSCFSPIRLSICLFVFPSICPAVFLLTSEIRWSTAHCWFRLSIFHLSVCPSFCLFVFSSHCLSAYLWNTLKYCSSLIPSLRGMLRLKCLPLPAPMLWNRKVESLG
jgi:hypothetical protein